MIGDAFQPRRRLRASQLNELARSADSAHLGAAGFLSQENGLEQVVRSPRRPIVARKSATSATDAIPAIITNCTQGIYSAVLFPDGLGAAAGETVDLVLTDVCQGASLPPGTVVIAHRIAVRAVQYGDDDGDGAESASGGDSEESESGGEE